MRITDVVIKDKNFRQYRKIQTLSNAIQRELDYHCDHNAHMVSHALRQKVQQYQDQLETVLRLDSTTFKSYTQKSGDWLKEPNRKIVAALFSGLPKPGKNKPDDLRQAVLDQMVQTGKNARAAQQRTLLEHEIAYRAKNQWFMLFNTLTVRDGELSNVFSATSDAFQSYIRRIDALAAKASYGSVRKALSHDYHTYFAVVELGGNTGRLHIHCLHFLRDLPEGCNDPNYGKSLPDRRELTAFKSLWTYGFSSPVMVRYSPQDAYGLAGYRWPYDTRKQNALTIGSPLRIGSYMAKYITKSYTQEKRGEYQWRVRKTHRTGLAIITELLAPLTARQLLTVATCPTMTATLNRSRLPHQVLRLQSLSLYRDRQLSDQTLTSLLDLGRCIEPRPSPLQCSLDITQISTIFSHQNFGNIQTINTKSADTFDNTFRALQISAETINRKYFPHSNDRPGTTSIRDHYHPKPN